MLKQLQMLSWLKDYNRETFNKDLFAAIMAAVILIPQSLAYAMLAGLPPEAGIYASVLPTIAYAIWGTSKILAVGPLAVIAIITASSIENLQLTSLSEYWAAATVLAVMSGSILVAMGLFRLGFIANFLSSAVIGGFLSASAIIIAIGQCKYILGIPVKGQTIIQQLESLIQHLPSTNLLLLVFGALTIIYLKSHKKIVDMFLGFKVCKSLEKYKNTLYRTGSLVAIFITTLMAYALNLEALGVALVGDIPVELPQLMMPEFSLQLCQDLFRSAILLAIIAYVGSISLAYTFAAKERNKIDPNRELIALGMSNIVAGFVRASPVAGGYSRTVIAAEAGVASQAAGIIIALTIFSVTLIFAPLLEHLPQATLSAIIMVAITRLIDMDMLKEAWRYSRDDFAAFLLTFMCTLLVGIDYGVIIGALISILIFLYKTSRPHIAIVGQIDGTQHYRNIDRHKAITEDNILSVRIDESLYFANVKYLEDFIYEKVADNQSTKHVVLLCSAINSMDVSATETLLRINENLLLSGIQLHFSEVKGPVTDKLSKIDFENRLSGNIYLSHHTAINDLKA